MRALVADRGEPQGLPGFVRSIHACSFVGMIGDEVACHTPSTAGGDEAGEKAPRGWGWRSQ